MSKHTPIVSKIREYLFSKLSDKELKIYIKNKKILEKAKGNLK